MVRGFVGFGKLGEGFEIVGLIGVERVAGHEVDDLGDGFEFDLIMQRARQVKAAEGFVGFRQLGEAGESWLGGVHRLRESDHRFLQHFGMFERDGDEHAGSTGWLALFLLPTAECAEADSKKVGERFLRKVE